MRTKQLMMVALAMPLAFAACTNEEIAEVNKTQILESEKIVGEKLIADGAVINLLEDAESRVTHVGNYYVFDENDNLGLAWFWNPQNAGESILDAQATKTFENQKNEIYNNYLVQYNLDRKQFEVNGEMYAGAYFIYYPYQKIGLGGSLTLDYSMKNNQSEKILTKERVNEVIMTNSFHLSHKMGLSQSKEDFKLEINAAPLNTMNTFAVQPTLLKEGDVYEAAKDLLDGIKIQSVQISLPKTEKVFANKADVDLTQLPTANSGKWNSTKTQELIQATVLRTATTPALKNFNELNSLTTNVNYDNSLAEESLGYILLSTFATSATTDSYNGTADVIVTTNVGTFKYTYDNTSELVQRLTGKDADGNSYAKNFMVGTNKVALIPVELNMADFALKTKDISEPEDWNYLMKLLEAKGGEKAEVSVKNLEFTEDTPMELPKNVKITVKSGNITFASGEQTIDKEFVTKGKLTVAVGATLNLKDDVTVGELINNGTTTVDAVLTTDKFTNNADAIMVINAGNKGINPVNTATYINNGTINCNGNIGGEVTNDGGVINVTYGATVVLHNGAGEVHGILNATENSEIANNQVKAIWQMIGSLSTVNCNSLELIGFELTEGDKYTEWGGSTFEITADKFQNVNVKFENSTLAKENDACEFKFNGLTLVKSTVTGDIYSTKAVNANESTVTGNLNAVGYDVELEASTVTGDVTGAEITLVTTNVTGDVAASADITLTTTNVIGDVTGANVTIDGGSIAGDVEATGDFSVEEATVNGVVKVTGDMTIKNSTVTAANGSKFAMGLTAEISTLTGSFVGLTENVVLTNCTINYETTTSTASTISTKKDLTINANGEVFNIYNTDLNAKNVTFNGNKDVMFRSTRLVATGTVNVNTNVKNKKITGLSDSTMSANDYVYAPGKSIYFVHEEN